MTDRPNIVLLVGEDTGLQLGCYGQPEAHTPNLDRLASEGCRYTHGYSVGPVCAPSRSCMVSGRYPWSPGTHHMRSTLLAPPRLFTRFGDLGLTDETDLVAQGVVANRLDDEFRPYISPLPSAYAARSGPTYLTLNEAEAARPRSRD